MHVAGKLSRVVVGLPMGVTLPETSQSFLQGPELFSFAWWENYLNMFQQTFPKCVLLHAPECPLASRSHHWLQFSLPKLESRCFGMPAPTSSTCSWAPLPPITPSWPGNETCLSLFAQNLDFLRSLQKLPVLLGSWGCPRVRASLHFTSLTPLVCWKPKVPWQSLGEPCWLLWSLKDLCVDL